MFNWIAVILGYIMNAIYVVLAGIAGLFTNGDGSVAVGNIGIAIILFTLIIYVAMLPLTYRQQKFSKLQAKMQPEIKAIQDKYKGKKDTDSQMAMNQEIQAVYGKYGVSMSGSCVQMVLQMVILLPLYRVIYNIPKYVPAVNDVFANLGNALVGLGNSASEKVTELLSGSASASAIVKEMTENGASSDYYAQLLNKFSTANWEDLSNWASSTGNTELVDTINTTSSNVETMNSFLGLTISNSPQFMFSEAIDKFHSAGFSAGVVLAIILAVIVPVLAFLTQYLSVKLTTSMTQSGQKLDPNDPAAQMQNSMKTMNVVMPIFSAWICFTLPAGMGIYWIAAAVIRTILAIIVNHRIDKIDIDAMIEENQAKYQKKLEKRKDLTPGLTNYANFSNRNLTSLTEEVTTSSVSEDDRTRRLEEVGALYDSGKARKDSLLNAANMVKEYDRTH
ncbi:YidC/Oxa1 family membrane protein insertase [Butyrivibrio fibrisolvens DSM 3071]|uniref:YidC/Oxa1 family membrane protein insertase n=1 Tax=Butyrivibrio fibrisolvens DSM 3071 TaxID=1121131 RepID=A0A1M6C5X2_BUTFI|nr:YidC/Oxa1 family membrane protein insertase [Butyrivibrio fibrisolvens]SHI56425.1 YidC/Oxa1 family membrane protein insertase [Butyrivibrio fibrisolvens DSM 3071]